MSILEYQYFYLVGIKGVAMTSFAQCLLDANKRVRGADVAENFVTDTILKKLPLLIDVGFAGELPAKTDCVIYTAAHQAQSNPLVQQALKKKIPVMSQAEALADLFNQKQGIAVCGVGGKSTTSAMITWMLHKTGVDCSFSIGVGNIPGLEKTGRWNENNPYFVAEADDYVIDPAALQAGQAITPRFSFLKPQVIVCTNLKYDHPDVYPSFEETKKQFGSFFRQLPSDGTLIVNAEDPALLELAQTVATEKKVKLITFGQHPATIRLSQVSSRAGITTGQIELANHQLLPLTLKLPGTYNLLNATAALAVIDTLGLSLEAAVATLAEFQSTQRRFEYIGKKNGVIYYDDYAHHPAEVAVAIQALNEWYPTQRKVIAFQSHTYSRTKQLFEEFVTALSLADEVAMIDIFASAREQDDPTVSSDKLCAALNQPGNTTATNYHTIDQLATYLKTLPPQTVVLTLGAGDIYQVHNRI